MSLFACSRRFSSRDALDQRGTCVIHGSRRQQCGRLFLVGGQQQKSDRGPGAPCRFPRARTSCWTFPSRAGEGAPRHRVRHVGPSPTLGARARRAPASRGGRRDLASPRGSAPRGLATLASALPRGQQQLGLGSSLRGDLGGARGEVGAPARVVLRRPRRGVHVLGRRCWDVRQRLG